MTRRREAFTLAELLVTIAIMAVLAAVLFPVFIRAKMAARKTSCLSNFHQSHLAVFQYCNDYDDFFMPVNHRPGGPLNSRVDRTWVQMVLPYARSFSVFRCPEDTRGEIVSGSTFDQDLVPGDPFSQYYTASQKVNTGYNYFYLAPIVKIAGNWQSLPRSSTIFADPSRAFLFVDSVGERDASGAASSGSWLVSPPCRFANESGRLVDTFGLGNGISPKIMTGYVGWDVNSPNSPFRYGSAWGWHSGYTTVVKMDGSVQVLHPDALSAGCIVQPRWGGTIGNPGQYLWDAQ